MELGHCFRRNHGDHLRIVVSDPGKDSNNVLTVSLTTFREGKFHDPSCFLDVGDHPFVKHKSYISFQHAVNRSNADWDRMLASGQIILEESKVTEDALERIHVGASNSEFIALEYLELLRSQGFFAD